MDAAQAHRCQEEPPARRRVAPGYVRPVGVDLGQFDLSPRQALLGRGQQPSHSLRPVALYEMAVIVQAVVVEDAEIALGPCVTRFSGLGAAVSRPRHSSPSVPEKTWTIAVGAAPSRCLSRKMAIAAPL